MSLTLGFGGVLNTITGEASGASSDFCFLLGVDVEGLDSSTTLKSKSETVSSTGFLFLESGFVFCGLYTVE